MGNSLARVGAAGGGPGCYRVVPGSYRETITFQDVPAGAYTVEWIEPATGRILEQRRATHAGGTLELRTPTYTVDLALRMKAAP